MLRICSNKNVAFDVDDCLVSQEANLNPSVPVLYQGQTLYVYVNQEIVDKIKEHFTKGHTVIVWSQSGDEWAEAVVKALNLTNFIHYVMTKVSDCYDDLSFREWCKLHKVKI